MPIRPILYDVLPGEFVELCLDPAGVRIELLEVTGLRAVDGDAVIGQLKGVLASRFEAEPRYRRIVTWTNAAMLKDHDEAEYQLVRGWLDDGLRDLQNPWRLPMVGEVAAAVLQGELPETIADRRVGPAWDLEHDRPRPVDRRAKPRR